MAMKIVQWVCKTESHLRPKNQSCGLSFSLRVNQHLKSGKSKFRFRIFYSYALFAKIVILTVLEIISIRKEKRNITIHSPNKNVLSDQSTV